MKNFEPKVAREDGREDFAKFSPVKQKNRREKFSKRHPWKFFEHQNFHGHFLIYFGNLNFWYKTTFKKCEMYVKKNRSDMLIFKLKLISYLFPLVPSDRFTALVRHMPAKNFQWRIQIFRTFLIVFDKPKCKIGDSSWIFHDLHFFLKIRLYISGHSTKVIIDVNGKVYGVLISWCNFDIFKKYAYLFQTEITFFF